jgi:hypothetical protein
MALTLVSEQMFCSVVGVMASITLILPTSDGKYYAMDTKRGTEPNASQLRIRTQR